MEKRRERARAKTKRNERRVMRLLHPVSIAFIQYFKSRTSHFTCVYRTNGRCTSLSLYLRKLAYPSERPPRPGPWARGGESIHSKYRTRISLFSARPLAAACVVAVIVVVVVVAAGTTAPRPGWG